MQKYLEARPAKLYKIICFTQSKLRQIEKNRPTKYDAFPKQFNNQLAWQGNKHINCKNWNKNSNADQFENHLVALFSKYTSNNQQNMSLCLTRKVWYNLEAKLSKL